MRRCPFEKSYWKTLDACKTIGDEAGMKWARHLLAAINDQHRLGLCACQNRGTDARND